MILTFVVKGLDHILHLRYLRFATALGLFPVDQVLYPSLQVIPILSRLLVCVKILVHLLVSL